MIRRLLGATGLLSLVAVAPPVASSRSDDRFNSIRVEHDIVFKSQGGTQLKLDLYLPQSQDDGPLPLLVFFHGGGYRKRDRSDFASLGFFSNTFLEDIQSGHLAVASADYRLTNEDTSISDIAADAKDAVRWLRKHAVEYQVDPASIGLLGHSTGAHLALLAALSDDRIFQGVEELREVSAAVKFVIGMSAPTDYLEHARYAAENSKKMSERESRLLNQLFGGTVDEVPERYREASPVTYLSPASPPVMLLAGSKDDLAIHTTWMQQMADETGAAVTVIMVENARHQIYRGYRDMSPTLEELGAKMREFALAKFEEP